MKDIQAKSEDSAAKAAGLPRLSGGTGALSYGGDQ